jgi:hypothetical protein
MWSAPDTEGTGLEPEPLLRGHSPLLRAYLPDAILPRAVFGVPASEQRSKRVTLGVIGLLNSA